MKVDSNDRNALWSDSVLMARIETFGYQMAEMGRQHGFENNYRAQGDYANAQFHAERAEMYRQSANTLKTDINAQITLRATNMLVVG